MLFNGRIKGYDTNGIANYSGYLLEDDFFFINSNMQDENGNPNNTLSGWQVGAAHGSFKCSASYGLEIYDNADTEPVWLYKQFPFQTDRKITLDFRFKLINPADGITWQLLNGELPVIKLGIIGEYIGSCDGGGSFIPIAPCVKDVEYGVKVEADLAAGSFDFYLDGQLIKCGLPFFRNDNQVDAFLLKTADDKSCSLLFSYIRIYTGFLVNESLCTTPPGKIPHGWVCSGDVRNIANYMLSHRDPNSFLLKSSADGICSSLTKSFPKISVPIAAEAMFMLPEAADGTFMQLVDNGEAIFSISSEGGALLCSFGGKTVALCHLNGAGNPVELKCLPRLWYTVKVVLDTEKSTMDLFVNYKKVLSGVKFAPEGVDAIRFLSPGAPDASLWADNIAVYTLPDYPVDYVPVPKKPNKTTKALLGMQYCPCWRIGTHISWDHSYRLATLDQYMGKYDEGCVETMDWQIKYMTEHGIDFLFIDWYQGYSKTEDMPLQKPLYNYTLESFFYSRYVDYQRVAIQVYGPFYSVKDYRDNIIPYWVNYYFTDPHYLVIDNRPVIGIGEPTRWIQMCGGEKGAREMIAFIKDACKKAGFDGAYVIATTVRENYSAEGNPESLKGLYAAGFEGVYEYTFGTSNIAMMKDVMLREHAMVTDPDGGCYGLSVIPTISAGWNLIANFPTKQSIPPRFMGTPPEDFDELCRWVKDFSENTLPDGSLGKRLIMVDNWNEYTEGHAINPCKFAGFSYLDSIGKHFTDTDNFHAVNIRPTPNQLLRINFGFPKTWNGGHEWNFDSFYNEPEFWSAEYGIVDFCTEGGGHLKGRLNIRHGITDSATTIVSPPNLMLEAYADKIMIRMRNGSRVKRAKLYFITDTSPVFDEDKCLVFELVPNDVEHTEYIIDASENKHWRGLINQIRLYFDALGMYDQGDFSIDYIRIGVHAPDTKAKTRRARPGAYGFLTPARQL